MKVRQLFAKDAIRYPTAQAEHLFIVTDDGRAFERFSDQPPGYWSEIPLPEARAKRAPKVRPKR